jgi:predicted Zn-dependent protease
MRLHGTLTFLTALLAGFSAQSRGDMTVESLTSNAVTGMGAYYQDVYDAIRSFGEQDYPEALSRLEKAKKTVPRLAPAEVMMAQLYFDANQPAGAIAMLEKAIKRVPEDPEAYIMLAERAVSEGRFVEADLLFAKSGNIVEVFADNPKRKQNLQHRSSIGWASADESRGNLKEARAKLESLLKIEPQNGDAHERLGKVLFAMEDQKGAHAEFRAAADADKTKPSAEIAMALLMKDQVNAEKWVKAAVAKGAQDLRTQIGAAQFFLKINQLDEARARAEEAVKLDPEGMESNLLRGLIARLLGEFKVAETHLSKAHLLFPSNTVVINGLALALLELPDDESHQRALRFAELNARQYSNNPEALATFAWVNFRLNHRIEAERAFAAMLSAARTGTVKYFNAEMGYYLANYAKERGQTADAIKMLKDSLNSNEPFAYRKPAQALLAKLSKLEKSKSAKGDEAPAASKKADSPTKAGAAK